MILEKTSEKAIVKKAGRISSDNKLINSHSLPAQIYCSETLERTTGEQDLGLEPEDPNK